MKAEVVLDAIRPYIEVGEIPGAVVGVLRDDQVSLDAAGMTAPGDRTPMAVDTLVRISSNTKPMVAALALSLVEEGALALADPVERFVPELADRRVLRRLDGPVEDTVPAGRRVTVEDLLTMRLGFGFVFEADCPALAAAAQAGLGIGPPDPSVSLTPPGAVANRLQDGEAKAMRGLRVSPSFLCWSSPAPSGATTLPTPCSVSCSPGLAGDLSTSCCVCGSSLRSR